MVVRFLIVFIPFLAACTLYQSEGREALEKNKGGIIGTSGFNTQKSMAYECLMSAQLPAEMNGPAVVLETPFEAQGFSAYLVQDETSDKILVYQLDKDSDLHHFCRIEPVQTLNAKTSADAVQLGVNLLIDRVNR